MWIVCVVSSIACIMPDPMSQSLDIEIRSRCEISGSFLSGYLFVIHSIYTITVDHIKQISEM